MIKKILKKVKFHIERYIQDDSCSNCGFPCNYAPGYEYKNIDEPISGIYIYKIKNPTLSQRNADMLYGVGYGHDGIVENLTMSEAESVAMLFSNIKGVPLNPALKRKIQRHGFNSHKHAQRKLGRA